MIPTSTAPLYTAADVADMERDLAQLVADHEAETDPAWRDELAEWIESDTAYLAEMIEVVEPMLPMWLPELPMRELRA